MPHRSRCLAGSWGLPCKPSRRHQAGAVHRRRPRAVFLTPGTKQQPALCALATRQSARDWRLLSVKRGAGSLKELLIWRQAVHRATGKEAKDPAPRWPGETWESQGCPNRTPPPTAGGGPPRLPPPSPREQGTVTGPSEGRRPPALPLSLKRLMEEMCWGEDYRLEPPQALLCLTSGCEGRGVDSTRAAEPGGKEGSRSARRKHTL